MEGTLIEEKRGEIGRKKGKKISTIFDLLFPSASARERRKAEYPKERAARLRVGVAYL